MLPRLQVLVSRSAAQRGVLVPRHVATAFSIPGPSSSQGSRACLRHFHASYRRQDELPKSPFQTFVDVLRDEIKKSRDLQDNVKQLQGDVDKFQDSEAMKKAKAAYERARVSPAPVCVIYLNQLHTTACG
jgi:mitochondrial import inner membrane translocase subunit TIM44